MRVSYVPDSSHLVSTPSPYMSKLYIPNTTPIRSYIYVIQYAHAQTIHLFTAPVLPGTTCAHPNRSAVAVPARAAAGPPMVSLFAPRDAGGPFAACGTATSGTARRQGGTGWEAAHWEEGRWWARWPVCACWRRGGMRRSSNLSANNKQQRGGGE